MRGNLEDLTELIFPHHPRVHSVWYLHLEGVPLETLKLAFLTEADCREGFYASSKNQVRRDKMWPKCARGNVSQALFRLNFMLNASN